MSDPTSSPTPLRFRFTYDELSAALAERVRALREARALSDRHAEIHAQEDRSAEAFAALEREVGEFHTNEDVARWTRLHKYLVRGAFYELTLEEFDSLLPPLRI